MAPPSAYGMADSDEDDGPMIPDLDDVQDEDMALQVGFISCRGADRPICLFVQKHFAYVYDHADKGLRSLLQA